MEQREKTKDRRASANRLPVGGGQGRERPWQRNQAQAVQESLELTEAMAMAGWARSSWSEWRRVCGKMSSVFLGMRKVGE